MFHLVHEICRVGLTATVGISQLAASITARHWHTTYYTLTCEAKAVCSSDPLPVQDSLPSMLLYLSKVNRLRSCIKEVEERSGEVE